MLVGVLADVRALQVALAPGRRLCSGGAQRQMRPARMMMSDDGVMEVSAEGGEGKALITLASISGDYRRSIEGALEVRNKERLLSGLEKYDSVQAMIDAYVEFEGRDKGMSVAACEDAVLRYLNRKAMLEEGAMEGDAQETVTFGLAALLIFGVGVGLVKSGIGIDPLAGSG